MTDSGNCVTSDSNPEIVGGIGPTYPTVALFYPLLL